MRTDVQKQVVEARQVINRAGMKHRLELVAFLQPGELTAKHVELHAHGRRGDEAAAGDEFGLEVAARRSRSRSRRTSGGRWPARQMNSRWSAGCPLKRSRGRPVVSIARP